MLNLNKPKEFSFKLGALTVYGIWHFKRRLHFHMTIDINTESSNKVYTSKPNVHCPQIGH